MGGSQSTRKLSVDNENAIQVSQEALDRIQAQLNAKRAEQPAPQPQFAPPPYYDKQKQHEYTPEEAYWAPRIENLKRAHEKINSGMHLEYQKTLKEANELFDVVQADKVVNKLPPCQEEKGKRAEQPAPQPQYAPPPYYDKQKQHEYAPEEAYWARRIENLKRAHEKINSGMHLEYQIKKTKKTRFYKKSN